MHRPRVVLRQELGGVQRLHLQVRGGVALLQGVWGGGGRGGGGAPHRPPAPQGQVRQGDKEESKAGVKVEENGKFKTEKAKVKILVEIKENNKKGNLKTEEVKCKVQVERKERDGK